MKRLGWAMLQAVAFRLRRWSDHLLQWTGDPSPRRVDGGPPVDWLERVWRGAPHLLRPGPLVRPRPPMIHRERPTEAPPPDPATPRSVPHVPAVGGESITSRSAAGSKSEFSIVVPRRPEASSGGEENQPPGPSRAERSLPPRTFRTGSFHRSVEEQNPSRGETSSVRESAQGTPVQRFEERASVTPVLSPCKPREVLLSESTVFPGKQTADFLESAPPPRQRPPEAQNQSTPGDDPWPRLPELFQPESMDEWNDHCRERERLLRLDREQKGAPWNA